NNASGYSYLMYYSYFVGEINEASSLHGTKRTMGTKRTNELKRGVFRTIGTKEEKKKRRLFRTHRTLIRFVP
ncbi:MAG: hypothetical protein AB8G77_24445, partial [Rhodothermales bacterium]